MGALLRRGAKRVARFEWQRKRETTLSKSEGIYDNRGL